MKLIFWNTNNFQDINSYADLIIDFDPDILFLAEISDSFMLKYMTNFEELGYAYQENPGCDRIKIIFKRSLKVELGIQNRFFTHIISNEINILSVHFPSEMNQHMDSLRNNLRSFRNILDSEIGASNEKSILIIGDFNVNPYEPAMINFDGFMATNSIKARSTIRSVLETREPYYNPTWKLYSNSTFPGTLKYPRPSVFSFDIIEYHFLDQVLLSNRLKNEIQFDEISIITNTKKFKFLNQRYNRVEFSDHLPLSYEFNKIKV